MTASVPRQGSLAGLKVLDLGTIIAAPGVARHLGDQGADVIKVEPPGGDPLRRMGWRQSPDSDSLYWKLVGRNKRSIVLDLKTEEDRRVLLDLAAQADVLIENMRPGKLESLGIGPDELLRVNPKLVILRVTGFGQQGPYSDRPGFATLAEAMSGLAAMSGYEESGPLLPPVALTDEVAAIAGAFAVMVGVYHSRSCGEGQVVDVNLLRTAIQLLGPLISAYDQLGYLQPRRGSTLPYSVPRGTFQTSDEKWIAISASSESVARRLLELLGMGGDSRLLSFPDRETNREVLDRSVTEWVAARTQIQALQELGESDIAAAPVYTVEDLVRDPHIQATAGAVKVDNVLVQSAVADFSATRGPLNHLGPDLDQHRAHILGEAREGWSSGPHDCRG